MAALRTTSAIRERAAALLHRARTGESRWFRVDDEQLQSAADAVAAVTRRRYPNLIIPVHSRWRHFEAGGVDRTERLCDLLADADATARGRALVDLVVVSVLLDAGAGPDWRFAEPGGAGCHARSEGLAVASWHAFISGVFSSDPDDPLRVDAAGLVGLRADQLGAAFQVSASNPLVGLDTRLQLMHRFGAALTADAGTFGDVGRPGHLLDALAPPGTGAVAAHDILTRLLASLSSIWLTGTEIGGHPLGDCWPHPAVGGEGLTAGWMPFHKLSQWLTYSLIEPFTWAGVRVERLDELTALPEYRNGGLLMDTGVLRLRDPAVADRDWEVGDEVIVEWRALTVALLDELAPLVRATLGDVAADMPLGCVLEGGTWAAGRELAQQRRGGGPPLSLISDGTVF